MDLNNLVTKSDLTRFRQEITNDLERIVKDNVSNSKAWLRTKEACEFLSVASSTLQNYRQQGLLTPKKVGGTLYYCRKQLSNLFNEAEL